MKIEDFIRAYKAIVCFVADKRQHDASKLRAFCVQQAMRGDVNNSVLADVTRAEIVFVCVEIEPNVSLAS